MINIKKGTAHTLQQADRLGVPYPSEGIVAGMVVKIVTDDDVDYVRKSSAGAGELIGFALNNQYDGDVIASGQLGLLLLDGNSVIETDQFEGEISAYSVGTLVSANNGLVTPATGNKRVIGIVEGVRKLPYVPHAASPSDPGWMVTDVVAIKLASL